MHRYALRRHLKRDTRRDTWHVTCYIRCIYLWQQSIATAWGLNIHRPCNYTAVYICPYAHMCLPFFTAVKADTWNTMWHATWNTRSIFSWQDAFKTACWLDTIRTRTRASLISHMSDVVSVYAHRYIPKHFRVLACIARTPGWVSPPRDVHVSYT